MKDKLKKINFLKIDSSTLQINFKEDYEYIDNVGKICNTFEDEFNNIKIDVIDVNGMVISNLSKSADSSHQLKISHSDIWCKFSNPSNLIFVNKLVNK